MGYWRRKLSRTATPTVDLVDSALGCGHSDRVGVARIERAFDSIARRQKCIETLHKRRVAPEEGADAFDDPGSVDTIFCQLSLSFRRAQITSET